jgi:predicted dehydrogenase
MIPKPHDLKTHPTTEGGLSRRRFLKTSAAAGAATALGALEITRSAHAAGSDILRVGLIGCGERNGGAAVQALTADPGARLVALCDIFMDRAEQTLENVRAALPEQVLAKRDQCFDGLDGYKMVIEASDVVLIANAAKFHPLHTLAAIEAGRHVFTEKPHGIDPAGVRVLDTACERAKEKGLCLVSGLHSRYHPGYAEVIQRIHDGQIGDVVAIEENFIRGPYRVIPRKPGLTELLYQLSNQYHFTWLSGDDVVQSLVHNLDRARWVLDEQIPVKCHGLGGRSSMVSEEYGNVFDHHSVVYEFETGVRLYAHCRTTTGCYNESSSIVMGTKGTASITRGIIRGENPWRWRDFVNPYQIEHDRLFAAIRSGQPINNGDYMGRSTLMAIMGQISCYTGEEITWERIRASNFHYPPRPEECHDGMEPPVRPGTDGSYAVPIPGQTRLLEPLPTGAPESP